MGRGIDNFTLISKLQLLMADSFDPLEYHYPNAFQSLEHIQSAVIVP